MIRMLDDVVVDTNVLLHAEDERQPFREDSQGLLADLVDGKARLCIDDGFDVDPAKNRSLIGGEYHDRVSPSCPSFGVLAELFRSGGVTFVPRGVPAAVKKSIEQSVRNKRDRTFICVAHNSSGKTLCSHDYTDLQPKKRKYLKEKTGVQVLTAAEARACL